MTESTDSHFWDQVSACDEVCTLHVAFPRLPVCVRWMHSLLGVKPIYVFIFNFTRTSPFLLQMWFLLLVSENHLSFSLLRCWYCFFLLYVYISWSLLCIRLIQELFLPNTVTNSVSLSKSLIPIWRYSPFTPLASHIFFSSMNSLWEFSIRRWPFSPVHVITALYQVVGMSWNL